MPRANKNKEAAIGSQNRTVSPNEAKSALTHCIKLQRPIMMWGAPGIGKSDIVKQIADAEGRDVIDIRLPLWEPTDIKGIPYYNAKENNMVWASPAELPTDPKSTAIVFLDEFVDCPYYVDKKKIIVTMEKMALQLMLFAGDITKYGLARAMSKMDEQKD